MIVKDGEEEGKRIWWWQHLTCAIIKLCCVSCHWNRLSLFFDYSTYKSIIMALCFYYEAILYFSNLSIILLAFETMKICLLYSPLQLATTQLYFPYAIWIRQWAKNPTSSVWNQNPFIVMLESSYHCGYFSTIPQIYGAHPLYSETSLQSLATVIFSIKGWATSLHNRLQCHPCAKPHQLIMANACRTNSLHSNNTYWIHNFSHKPQNKILSTQCASVLIRNLFFIGEGILMSWTILQAGIAPGNHMVLMLVLDLLDPIISGFTKQNMHTAQMSFCCCCSQKGIMPDVALWGGTMPLLWTPMGLPLNCSIMLPITSSKDLSKSCLSTLPPASASRTLNASLTTLSICTNNPPTHHPQQAA